MMADGKTWIDLIALVVFMSFCAFVIWRMTK